MLFLHKSWLPSHTCQRYTNKSPYHSIHPQQSKYTQCRFYGFIGLVIKFINQFQNILLLQLRSVLCHLQITLVSRSGHFFVLKELSCLFKVRNSLVDLLVSFIILSYFLSEDQKPQIYLLVKLLTQCSVRV